MKTLMAIDAGTGSVRAVLFDLEGHQLGCVSREWYHKEDKYPGSMNFDWKTNWELTKECIKGVISQADANPDEIAAISTTCMREGIVLYDDKGEEIWACANVDSRAKEEAEEIITKNPKLELEVYKKTGQTSALDAIPRLLWIKNKEPDIYKKISKLTMFNDWLIYKLSGEFCCEPSNASTTGLVNLKLRDWDLDIAKQFDISPNIFPKIIESGSLFSTVNKKAALETGLKEGTPIVVGGGDAQLGCIGVGVVDDFEAAVFGGSFWQYEYNTSSPAIDDKSKVRVNCHAVKNIWQYEAIAFNPGLIMRWFRDAFCEYEKEEAKKAGRDVYDLMNEKASKVPIGCYGMKCAFSDIMDYPNWRHAAPAFSNFSLDPEKFNKYTFYRAILENAALLTRGHIELVYEQTGNKPEFITFASGASKSPLWCQILADATGLEVRVPEVKEATALGAAILAGVGVGIYKNVSETAKKLVKISAVYKPDIKNYAVYSDVFASWKNWYAKELEIADLGLTNHMWAAPGSNRR